MSVGRKKKNNDRRKIKNIYIILKKMVDVGINN